MTRMFMRLCYLCYVDGETKGATHKYYAEGADDWYDVCDSHTEVVREAGNETEEIPVGERILEEWEI